LKKNEIISEDSFKFEIKKHIDLPIVLVGECANILYLHYNSKTQSTLEDILADYDIEKIIQLSKHYETNEETELLKKYKKKRKYKRKKKKKIF